MFIVILSGVGAELSLVGRTALAAGLDRKGEAEAKEATRLFKQGLYEEAAPLYAKLSVDYPDMAVFERNLGACYYHLRRPEPALSNLQHYLGRKKAISAEDKATVEQWISEMERLREQDKAAATMPNPQPSSPPSAQPLEMKPAVALGPDLAAQPNETQAKPAGLGLTDSHTEHASAETDSPFYKKWWVWGAVGAVAIAGVVTAVVLSSGKTSSSIPSSALGNQGAF
jgi:tetratricopeptide (TPR) repeat protein